MNLVGSGMSMYCHGGGEHSRLLGDYAVILTH